MKKERKNKGITLIALIITIIIMLILVGVSVNVAINGDLFETAKAAGEKTNQAAQTENDYMVYVQLIAEADELVERYPFNGIFEAGGGVQLHNANISYLYEYILEKYGATTENLDYSTAVKAANTFYEIYDIEIQRVASAYNRKNFWKKLANPMDNSGIFFQNFTPTTEEINTRVALQLGFMFSKNSPIDRSVNGIAILDAKANNVRHYVIGNPNVVFDATSTDPTIATINTAYNTAFPGGHFPIDTITGTEISIPDVFNSSQGAGEICVLTEENANNILSKNSIVKWITGSEILEGEDVNLNDYIGNTICLISIEQGGINYYFGFALKNVFVLNTETGDIIYIDDNSQPNKSFL